MIYPINHILFTSDKFPSFDNSVTQLHVNICGNDSMFWEL